MSEIQAGLPQDRPSQNEDGAPGTLAILVGSGRRGWSVVGFESDDHSALLDLHVGVEFVGAAGSESGVEILASGEDQFVAFGFEGSQNRGIWRLAGGADGVFVGVIVGFHNGVELFSVGSHDTEKHFGVVVAEPDGMTNPHFFLFGIPDGLAQVVEDDEVGLRVGDQFGVEAAVDDRGSIDGFFFLRLCVQHGESEKEEESRDDYVEFHYCLRSDQLR